MADKSFVLRIEMQNGQAVIKGLDDIGDKGERAFKRVKQAADDQASAGMRGLNAAMAEGQQAMDGYVRRAGPFGNILASMGKGGYAAAAGLGAAAAAAVLLTGKIGATLKAMDDIADKSQRLQISIETLQALRLAARDAGYELEEGDAAAQAIRDARLSALSGTKGAKKSLQLFADFGISKSELLQLSDVEGLLNRISQGAKAMGNDMVAAAKLSKLGLDPLKELLLGMPGDIETATESFRQQGMIIDETIVQKAAEANAQWEAMETKITVALTPAIVDMAEQAIPALQKLIDFLRDALSMIDVLERSQEQVLMDRAEAWVEIWGRAKDSMLGGGVWGGGNGILPGIYSEETALANIKKTAAAIGRLRRGEAADGGGSPPPSVGTATSEDLAMLRKPKPRNQFVPGGDGEGEGEGAAEAAKAAAAAERERAEALKQVLELKGKEAQINAKLVETIETLRKGHAQQVEGLKTEAELNAAIAAATAQANAEVQKARDDQSKWIKGVISGAQALIDILDGAEQRQEGINLRMGVFNQLLSGSITSASDLLDLFVKIVEQIAQMAAQMAIQGKGDFWSNVVDIAGGLLGLGGGSASTASAAAGKGVGSFLNLFGGGRAAGGPTQAGMVYRWDETGGEKFIMSNRDGYVANPHQVAEMMARQGAATRAAAAWPAINVQNIVINVQNIVNNNAGVDVEQRQTRDGNGGLKLETILNPKIDARMNENLQGGRSDSSLRSRIGARPRLLSR